MGKHRFSSNGQSPGIWDRASDKALVDDANDADDVNDDTDDDAGVAGNPDGTDEYFVTSVGTTFIDAQTQLLFLTETNLERLKERFLW